MITLNKLIQEALEIEADLPEAEVTGIAQDSRKVKEGYIFVARIGEIIDGHNFISAATQKGAVAIVGIYEPSKFNLDIPYIKVGNDKIALARLAASFYQHPSKKMFTIGITGTDGKTSTAYLLHHLLSDKYKTGLMSTAGIKIASEALELIGHFTTPEAPEIQSCLANFHNAGCTHAVIESSSHGFAMHRLDEVDYDLGVWTNLTPEHLDYHKSFAAYLEAKLTLVKRANSSILNADDPSFPEFAKAAKQTISYGIEGSNLNWQASEIREEAGTLHFKLKANLNSNSFEGFAVLPMIGIYNVYNALAALATAHKVGLDIHYLLGRLSSFAGVPGRMQVVQREPFMVVVDFAHTAPALEKALKAVRNLTKGKIIVVIGAAGERDTGKRYPIGKTAGEWADIAIFTEEDSRSEDIDEILSQIAKGAKEAGAKEGEQFLLEPDRKEAIRQAIALAKAKDIVLLCGKGHETTLERQNEVLQWDEVSEAERALTLNPFL